MTGTRAARIVVVGLALLVALLTATVVLAAPLGTAFTYQGQLRQAGVPINGTCDVQFSLFDAATGGTQVGTTQTATGLTLVDGRFTVQLDFGGAAFDGNARWLQIATRCPSGSGGFTALDPRQPLTPSPYALFAQSAASALTATTATTATSFSGPLAGDVTGTQSATVVARLQGRNVANTAPVQDDVLRYNATATQWEPGPEVNARNYLFVYDTTTQSIPSSASFVNIGFSSIGPSDSWIVAASQFQAAQSGLYLVQYEARPATMVGAPATVSFRVRQSGAEIPGSQSSVSLPSDSTAHISKAFLVQVAAGDVLGLQAASIVSSATIAPAGTGDTLISASLTITRVR